MIGLDDTQPAETRPSRPIEATRPSPAIPRRRRRVRPAAVFLALLLALPVCGYLVAPWRTNVLVLGIDRAPEGTAAGRSDTMILTTCMPSRPYVGALSIPRDLWVVLPDGSANRINTAHFFAEVAEPGSGPEAARRTVEHNFGVTVHHTVRVNFDSLVELIDSVGGVTVRLESGSGSYPPGEYTLNGAQALAFARDRAGSDDFGRMLKGQILARALFRALLEPANWPRIPAAASALSRTARSDIPIWEWPRLAVCLLRVGPEGIESRTLDRTMAVGFTTGEGAQVLAPQWQAINPVLLEMFGQ